MRSFLAVRDPHALEGLSACTLCPPLNTVCPGTTRFREDLRLGRSLAYARGTAPHAVRLSPDTVLPLCKLFATHLQVAQRIGGVGGEERARLSRHKLDRSAFSSLS